MKTVYKKILLRSLMLLLAVGLVFGISSCRSGNDAEPQYYLRAKINGQQKDFLKNAKYQADIATWQHIIFGGDELKTSVNSGFEIEIWNEGGNIKTGTYTYQPNGDSNDPADYSVDCQYYVQTDGGTVVYNTFDTENFTFVISEISNNGIRGTFHGSISSNDYPGQV